MNRISFVFLFGIYQIGMVVHVISSGQVEFDRIDMPRFVGQMVGRILSILLLAAAAGGSLAMIRRRNLGFAKFAAVVLAISCFGFFVFPFAIWACVLLFSDRASRDFS